MCRVVCLCLCVCGCGWVGDVYACPSSVFVCGGVIYMRVHVLSLCVCVGCVCLCGVYASSWSLSVFQGVCVVFMCAHGLCVWVCLSKLCVCVCACLECVSVDVRAVFMCVSMVCVCVSECTSHCDTRAKNLRL